MEASLKVCRAIEVLSRYRVKYIGYSIKSIANHSAASRSKRLGILFKRQVEVSVRNSASEGLSDVFDMADNGAYAVVWPCL